MKIVISQYASTVITVTIFGLLMLLFAQSGLQLRQLYLAHQMQLTQNTSSPDLLAYERQAGIEVTVLPEIGIYTGDVNQINDCFVARTKEGQAAELSVKDIVCLSGNGDWEIFDNGMFRIMTVGDYAFALSAKDANGQDCLVYLELPVLEGL